MPLHKSLNNIAVHTVMERVSFCLDAGMLIDGLSATNSTSHIHVSQKEDNQHFYRSSWPSPWLTEINSHQKVTKALVQIYEIHTM